MKCGDMPTSTEYKVYASVLRGLNYESKDSVIAKFDSLISPYISKGFAQKYIIGSSVLGKQIPMYRIGNVNGGRILCDGQMHGSEDVGTELLYLWAQWILTSGDAEAERIKRQNCWFIIPVLNIDEYRRTNAHYVNINRNFAYYFNRAGALPYCTAASPSHYTYNPLVGDPDHGYPPHWTGPLANENLNYYPFELLPSTWTCPVCGAAKSTFKGTADWRGPSAVSEPESKALLNALKQWQPKAYFNHHLYDGPFVNAYFINAAQQTFQQNMANKIAAIEINELDVTPIPFNIYGCSAGFSTADASSLGIYSSLIEWNVSAPPISELPGRWFSWWKAIALGYSRQFAVISPTTSLLPLIVIGGVLLFLLTRGK